ncbi:MAG: hypothetical protein GY756_00150 [bacterium]|nr:hypothetical protein [bacterium]
MRKFILLFIMVSIGNLLSAQIIQNRFEELFLYVSLENGISVSVNLYGLINGINADIPGSVEYHSSGEFNRKIKRIGNTDIEYNSSGYFKGRIKNIGTMQFHYYNYGNAKGEIDRIGHQYFRYYRTGYLKGKIQSIGGKHFLYYTYGYFKGKIKGIEGF